MQLWLELHDSTLKGIARAGAQLELLIDGYVHRWEETGGEWKGTGWMRTIRLVLAEARCSATPRMPVDIATGAIVSSSRAFDNFVPMPLELIESVSLRLELADGDPLNVDGRSIRIEGSGAARFVEELPRDLRPASADRERK